MHRQELEQLARRLLDGDLALDEFMRAAAQPTADLAEAQIDLDRQRRCGFPEVIFGEGKTPATLEKIFRRQIAAGIDVLATRIAPEKAAELAPKFPTGRYATTPWPGPIAFR
jgi:NCAIR mutase (PurE)-related protein